MRESRAAHPPARAAIEHDVERRLPNPRILAIGVFAAAGLFLANAAFQAMRSYWDTASVWTLPYGLLILMVFGVLARLRMRPVYIALITLTVAVAWTFVSGSQPFTDFEGFYKLAADFASTHSLGALAATKSTTTALFFGIWMNLAGTSVAAARLGGALALAVTAFSVSLLGRHLGYPAFAWRFAGIAVGLSPALLVYSPVISTELPLLAALTGGMCAFVVSLSARDPRPWGVVAGLLLGLAFLAVPTAVMFSTGAFLVMAGRWIWRRTGVARRALIALLIGLAIFPLAQTLLNWQYAGRLSPSPYPWAALAVLQGTSVACDAGWCPQDLELVGYFDENVSKAEADARAWRLARERWRDDPSGLLWFSLTTKQEVLWAGESQLVHWTLYKSSHYEAWDDTGVLDMLRRVTDGYFFAAMALLIPAMFVLSRSRLLGWPEAAIAFGIAGSGLVHTLLSVQQRYHLIYMPFIFLMLGLAAHTVLASKLNRPLRRRRPASGERIVSSATAI